MPFKFVSHFLKKNILQVLQESLLWLNNWEQKLIQGLIGEDQFLTALTSEGLRVSIQSTMDLCNTLIKEFRFNYIVTGRINQDPLEVYKMKKMLNLV